MGVRISWLMLARKALLAALAASAASRASASFPGGFHLVGDIAKSAYDPPRNGRRSLRWEPRFTLRMRWAARPARRGGSAHRKTGCPVAITRLKTRSSSGRRCPSRVSRCQSSILNRSCVHTWLRNAKQTAGFRVGVNHACFLIHHDKSGNARIKDPREQIPLGGKGGLHLSALCDVPVPPRKSSPPLRKRAPLQPALAPVATNEALFKTQAPPIRRLGKKRPRPPKGDLQDGESR